VPLVAEEALERRRHGLVVVDHQDMSHRAARRLQTRWQPSRESR
jgi:hypothetical protein